MRTGIDIVDIRRIQSILDKKKEKFYNKLFTPREIQFFQSRRDNPETVAGHFAAKEAVSKMLGTGIGHIAWKDIEVLHDKCGKPYINMTDKISRHLEDMNLNHMDISITHEKEFSVAMAIGFLDEKIKSIAKNKNMKLPIRDKNAHKGDFGKVGIIAGSYGMTGAAYLCASAALRTGSGLVYSIASSDISHILSAKFTEVIVKDLNTPEEILDFIDGLDGVAIGPGLGLNEEKRKIVNQVLKNYEKPLVVDGDGINLMDKDVLRNRKATTIITPHSGEMGRFIGRDSKEVDDNRIYYSKMASNKYNVITILKGNRTIISQNDKLYINDTGNPGMATAGSGDVLAGMIISLICQNLDPFHACTMAVYAHGLAGDMAKLDFGEYGMIASDILNYMPKALRSL